MGKIVWTEDYSVGDPEIDRQHKQWIDIYNEFHDQMMQGNANMGPLGTGGTVLQRMIDYCRFHFTSEERVMEEIHFVELDAHRKIHREFIKKLDSIAYQMDHGDRVLNSEIIKIIENWLNHHILYEDKKILKREKE